MVSPSGYFFRYPTQGINTVMEFFCSLYCFQSYAEFFGNYSRRAVWAFFNVVILTTLFLRVLISGLRSTALLPRLILLTPDESEFGRIVCPLGSSFAGLVYAVF